MDSPPVVGTLTIAHLCDVILDTLRSFGNAAVDFTAFRGEVQTLRRFLDLIERIRKANAPRTSFEEEHFSDLEALLARCRDTLARLCDILADSKVNYHKAAPQDALQQALRGIQNSETVALRARISLYVQSLQMTLHVVKLVYQWKSQLPQDGVFYHQKALSEAIQLLRESVACRKGLTQTRTHNSPMQEEAFLYDIEKCLFSAEVIMSVTNTTVYENAQSPWVQLPSELPGTPVDETVSMNSQIPRKPSLPLLNPPQIRIPKSRDRTPDRGPRSRDRSPLPRRPNGQRHIAEAAIRPKASNPRLDKPIMFHLDDINTKHRGSSSSETDSIFDPEPEFEDRFPDAVYTELITGLEQEVQRAVQRGDYQRAEESHRKAMEYFTDRERKLGIPFDSKTEMQETLADIYIMQRQPQKAKQILNRLLMQEKDDTPRKWRLYHALADIYQEQDRLMEAEKFAKRAYIGREKTLQKDDELLLQSVNLLIKIYERQHRLDTAEALRKVYQTECPPPQVPPKSRQRDRAASQTQNQPHLQSQPIMQPSPQVQTQIQAQHQAQPQAAAQNQTKLQTQQQYQNLPQPPVQHQHQHVAPPQSPTRSQPQSPLRPDDAYDFGKSSVRWAPDAWVDSSSIDAPTKSGETPLISAINTGDDELVKLILKRGADVEARCVDQMTPLMHAVNHGFESIVTILLDKDAQVDASTEGWTPLHRAADMVNLPIAKILLAHHADIDARSPKDFTPKKHSLARMGGSDLDDYDEVDASEADIGWTALLRAAVNGQEAMVRLLIDHGADIEARSPSNGTPLICAAEGNHEAIIDFLLHRGASVHASDDFGWAPLHRALVSRRSGGSAERVAQMLLTHGAHIDARCTYSKTPLHHAIEKGNDTMVSFLLSAGADYEARDSAERTPLHTAIESRRELMVRILLEAGADADAKDRGGRDALAVANHAQRRSPEVIGLLARHKKERKAKRGSVGSRQPSISGSSVGKGSVSRSSSSSWWGSVRSRKEKK